MKGGQPSKSERQARYRTGHRSEWLAALTLKLRGYRVLDRRWKSFAGEIDLLAVRRNRLSFVEVKHRPDVTDEEAHAAISDQQRRRIREAADIWLSRNRRYREHDISFDLVLIAPRRWPRLIKDGL
jgi:putative endonuclease